MDKSLPLIVFDGRDPDLAKYNGPVRGRGAAYLCTSVRILELELPKKARQRTRTRSFLIVKAVNSWSVRLAARDHIFGSCLFQW